MLKLKQILCSILVLGSLLSSPSLWAQKETKVNICLLYTSDAADE